MLRVLRKEKVLDYILNATNILVHGELFEIAALYTLKKMKF